MSCFDLFCELVQSSVSEVSLDLHNYYQEASKVACYTLEETVYSTERLGLEEKLRKKYSLVRFINFNAQEYCKYRNVPPRTKDGNSRDHFLSTVLHTFIRDVENKFSSSDAIREVMMSPFSTLICVLLTDKNDKKFKIVGGFFYSCSPTYGVLVPLMIVNNEFQKKGLGKHFLRSIQKFTMYILRTRRCLVWYTYDAKNTLLSFYRKLGFHPAITSNFAIEHSLPLSLIQEINSIGNDEYLIECLEDICTKKVEHSIPHNAKQRTCEICGVTSKYIIVCDHKLKNSSYCKTGKSKYNICGIQICYSCNSQFGVSSGEDRCVFHSIHKLKWRYAKATSIRKTSRLYSENRKVCKKIYDIHQDIINMATNDKQNFYQGYHESFNHETANIETKCKHCFLIQNKISFSCFQLLGSLQAQNRQGNNESPWSHLNYIVNNRFEFKNQYELTTKLKLHKEKSCPINGSIRHNQFFDENIGRPSTLLQNCILGIKNVVGCGDCGVLSILLPILSATIGIREKIYREMNTVYKAYDYGYQGGLEMHEIFSIKGIRTILCYAKLHSNRFVDELDLEGNPFLLSEFESIKELEKNNNENDSEVLNYTRDSFREHFALTYEDEMNDHHDENIYWLANSDMMNLVSASNGMICVLGVSESTTEEIEKNQFNSIIHDFGFYATCEEHILLKAKYFILLRHIDGQHFDYFYDKRNQCALFEINFDKRESVINYILQFCSPTQYFELTGKKQNFDKFGDESESFYFKLPDSKTWNQTFDAKYAQREKYINETKIDWIHDAKTYLKKKNALLIPVILFPDEFKKEPLINLMIYLYHTPNQQVSLYDHNKFKLNNNRMATLCTACKKDVINLDAIELQKVVKKVDQADILLCEQFISHQVFQLKVYNSGRLCNSFYSDNFGSGDIFRFREDEEFLKQACLILSRKHDNNITKTQFFFIYKMIKQKKKPEKLYFDYYYDFDMRNNPTRLQEWFYRTNPEYSLKFNSETDDFENLKNATKKIDDKNLCYLLLDINEVHSFWQGKFSTSSKRKNKTAVTNIFQFLQNLLNHQFPTISVRTTMGSTNAKNLPAVYNSVKWISFFQYQDSSLVDQHINDKSDHTIHSWSKKKIMGFYLLSSLMEHNGDLKYPILDKTHLCFGLNDLIMLQDSLLFHCGYSKNELKDVFNLSSSLPPAKRKNTTQNQQTNQNAKSNTSPTVPTSEQPQETINNPPKKENKKAGQPTKANTIPVPVSKKPKVTEIDLNKTITKAKKSKVRDKNLAYARYLIAEKESTAYEMFKILEQDNLSITQLTEKCKDVGLMVNPNSKENKEDQENENTYRQAFEIARNAAVKLFAEKFQNSTSETDQEKSEI